MLWIDEVEKGLAGGTGNGQSDAGTASRVFGTLLTWMQERSEPVFVVVRGDGRVLADDVAILLEAWGRVDECLAELEGDGLVGWAELVILLGNWG